MKQLEEIVRIEVDKKKIQMYEYHTLFLNDNITGRVDLLFRELKQYLNPKVMDSTQTDIHKPLMNAGIGMDDIVSELYFFYPNGSYDKKNAPYGQGVATRVLEMVTKDSYERDSRAITVCTRSDTLIPFIKRRGFTEYRNDWFYKLL